MCSATAHSILALTVALFGFRKTQAKEEMMETMGLNTEEEGSTMAFLRRGYKVRGLAMPSSR